MSRLFSKPIGICASLLALALFSPTVGCAYNATGLAPPKTLIFEFTVEGETFLQSPNFAYYFVLDTKGKPDDAPLMNGPAPLTFPYPDPRAYLPWIRDEKIAVLDRDTIPVPESPWSTYFALYEEAGQFVVWQGRPNEDGTVNERVRQLQKGREWGFKDTRTFQLTLPFTLILEPDAKVEPQWECNLGVAYRGTSRNWRDFVIERWLGLVPNPSFAIRTTPINQNLYDSVGGVTYPVNMPQNTDPRNLNIVSITYRIVAN